MTIEEVINLANARSGKQNYLAQQDPSLPLVSALVDLVNTAASGVVVGSYSVTLAVTADFTVPAFTIATIPQDGHYQFIGMVSFRNGTANPPPATFIAEFTYSDGGGGPVGPTTFIGINGGLDQTAAVAATTPTTFVSQAGSLVTINYGATGITYGAVDVVLSAAVIKLA